MKYDKHDTLKRF